MGFRRTLVGGLVVDEPIHAREPQLIKLPIPLPPIPVLQPIISPLVGGSNQNTNSGTTTTTTTAATNTPAPAQPTSSSSPPSSNGGGNSSPGGSTPITGGNGSPNPGGDGSPSNGSPADVPPIVVPGSGHVSNDTPTSGSSGHSPTTGGALPSGVSTITPPTSGSILEGGGGVTAATGSDNLAINDPSGAIANAASVPNVSQGNLSQNPGGSNTLTAGGSSSTASGNDPNNATPVSGAEKGHISTGAVVAIVIICLAFFFILLVLFFRRRAKARRNERANMWWFSRKRTSQTYGDAEVLVAGSQMACSGFTIPSTIPRPPPMAEVRRETAGSLQAAINSWRCNTEVPDNRFSVGSNHSENSQFLFVNLRSSLQITPESGQAFSPSSESFAFPKPPPPSVGDRTSAYSRPSSYHGTLKATMGRHNSDDAIFSSLPPVPSPPSAAPLIGDDPFASDPFRDNNPFEDSQRAAAPAILNEIIRRPYQRNLEDEVTVNAGEYVHVLTTFDDGWAYVVKVPGTGLGRGDSEDVSGGSKGLIPMECFREPGEDLPASIAAKRVSSYGNEATFTAL